MQSNFGPDFFIKNRAKLREQVTSDAPIVITANGQLQASGDNTFPFQQDTSFWYLTGVDQADYILVISKNETYLIAPTRSSVQDLFDGTTDDGAIQKTSGIDTILSLVKGWEKLKNDLLASKQVHTLRANPAYITVYGMYTNPARARLTQHMKRAVPGLEVMDIRSALAKLRVIKQAPEIATIRKAIDISCATLNEVQRNTYAYEYELEADITRGFRRQGARGHAYSPIVAGGLNACTLHYLENNAPLDTTELILADVGAGYDHYAADLTRTWSSVKPSDRQEAIFTAVNEALMYGIDQLKPGPSFYECEQRVREFVGGKLKELGLLKHIDEEGVNQYYPHAPHYLGLDMHDVGDTRQPLEAGMILTLEPGIYVPEDRIGVRLEEDILITENGCEVLSRACPRELTPVQ